MDRKTSVSRVEEAKERKFDDIIKQGRRAK